MTFSMFCIGVLFAFIGLVGLCGFQIPTNVDAIIYDGLVGSFLFFGLAIIFYEIGAGREKQ